MYQHPLHSSLNPRFVKNEELWHNSGKIKSNMQNPSDAECDGKRKPSLQLIFETQNQDRVEKLKTQLKDEGTRPRMAKFLAKLSERYPRTKAGSEEYYITCKYMTRKRYRSRYRDYRTCDVSTIHPHQSVRLQSKYTLTNLIPTNERNHSSYSVIM